MSRDNEAIPDLSAAAEPGGIVTRADLDHFPYQSLAIRPLLIVRTGLHLDKKWAR